MPALTFRVGGGLADLVSHVFTLGHVAKMLGEDEDWLFEVAEEKWTPRMASYGSLGSVKTGVMAFTDDGVENLKGLIGIHKNAPWIIKERQQVLAEIIKRDI
jgi:hypothetical protein